MGLTKYLLALGAVLSAGALGAQTNRLPTSGQVVPPPAAATTACRHLVDRADHDL